MIKPNWGLHFMLCYHNQYNNKLYIIKLKYLIKIKSKTENEKEKPKKQSVSVHMCVLFTYMFVK